MSKSPAPTEREIRNVGAVAYLLDPDRISTLGVLKRLSFVKTDERTVSVRPEGFNVEIARLTMTGTNAEKDMARLTTALQVLSFWDIPLSDRYYRERIRNIRNARSRRREKSARRK